MTVVQGYARRVARPGQALTAREVGVLKLASFGWPAARIASELCLSEHTVKAHLLRVSVKLGVKRRAALTARGFETGVLTARPLRPRVVVPSLDPQLSEILPLIAVGLSYAGIGERIGRSKSAVKSRVHRLLRFLGASGEAEIVRLAVEAGYLRLSRDGLWVAS